MKLWCSDYSEINRLIELQPIYQPIWKISIHSLVGGQLTEKPNVNKRTNKDKKNFESNWSQRRPSVQTDSRLVEKISSPHILDVRADDVHWNDNEGYTIKPSGSKNSTASQESNWAANLLRHTQV